MINYSINFKAKLSVSSAWWLLNRGANNGKTLVGMAKGWPWPLDRAGCLMEV